MGEGVQALDSSAAFIVVHDENIRFVPATELWTSTMGS